MAFWIVVQNGVVTGFHDAAQNLFKIYDNTVNWFLADSVPAFTAFQSSVNVTPTFVPTGDNLEAGMETPRTLIPITSIERTELLSVPDPRLTMTVTDAKTAVLSMLNARIDHEINLSYPIQTQLTIRALGVKPGGGNYSNSDVTAMDTFINGKNTLRNTKATEINAKTTVADLIAYNVYA